MFYIYADGKLLNQPLEDSLIVMAPKLILEMGKAGSLEFSIPPNNTHYNALRILKTLITVDLDETELFRGRVLSHDRNFNNVKKIYAEGDLAYLVDSAQKPEKFTGTTHELFRKIVAAHNAQMDAEKQFTVGDITIENRSIVITGQSEEIENLVTGDFDYRQIAINSTSNDWPTTYDYIEHCLIEYCGGYLRSRRVGNVTYLDLITDYGNVATQEIELGKNILDLTEEAIPEEILTVLIPLGDENLTIDSVNGGSNELVDTAAVDLYGRIVKTHVFENVNQPSTLLENAQRFMANHENVPITFTIKAVDMHLVDPSVQEIHVGDRVYVRSTPHDVSGAFICTRIEYDLENPANNTYVFGNPKQTLTQRYRKDKRKDNSSGAGGAAEAVEEEAKEGLQEIFDAWINPDPEAGTISLGALHKLVKEKKDILLTQVGIDLDADPNESSTPNINIRSLHNQVEDIDGRVVRSNAQIQMWSNELEARITQQAAWNDEFDGKTRSLYSNLVLETNAREGAIANLQTMYNSRLADIQFLVDETRASALMKAAYDTNRTADLQLISNLESNIATLQASHSGKISSLETRVDNQETSAVMKSEYETKIAAIETKANALESSISANAEAISLKANKASLNAAVTTINDRIQIVEDDILGIDELIARKISAADIDVTKLTSKTLRVISVTADSLIAVNNISAPIIRMGTRPVATESYVNDRVEGLVTSSWISEQNFSTKAYVDDKNKWGTSPETGKNWLFLGGISKLVALGNHTHSDYAASTHNHDTSYAAKSHTHTGYAASSHSHSGYVEKDDTGWGTASSGKRYLQVKGTNVYVALGNHKHTIKIDGTTYTTGGPTL